MSVGTKVLSLMLLVILCLPGCGTFTHDESAVPEPEPATNSEPMPISAEGVAPEVEPESVESEDSAPVLDVGLHPTDETGAHYAFTYAGEEFNVTYRPDWWTVHDSYRIKDIHDITAICQTLIDEHPVHGVDLESYRTAEDMAYEWEQHNLIYRLLPEDNPWRQHAKDVDLDPQDQGLTFTEMYERRTGKELDIRSPV